MLADALKRIDEGECVIDPTIVSRLLKRPREQGPVDREVFADVENVLVAQGAVGAQNKDVVSHAVVGEFHADQCCSWPGFALGGFDATKWANPLVLRSFVPFVVVELRGKWGGEKGGDEDAYPDGNPHEDRVTRIWVAGLKYAESDQHSCDYECERYAVDPVEQLTHPRPAEYAGFQSEDDREDEKHLHGRFVERNVVRRHVYKCRRGIGSFDVPNDYRRESTTHPKCRMEWWFFTQRRIRDSNPCYRRML